MRRRALLTTTLAVPAAISGMTAGALVSSAILALVTTASLSESLEPPGPKHFDWRQGTFERG